MHAYHAPYALDRRPALAFGVRLVATLAATAAMATALATAGPGNGYLPPEQWAAAHRADVVRVTLPAVQVVGQASAPQAVASVACAKGA